ncbi:MAG: hypothetical protein K0S74_228 [Chlamydiales bacterium]|jgi:hypothetical protein|nr:hypothetical protein [Chlamydiales bacterium]
MSINNNINNPALGPTTHNNIPTGKHFIEVTNDKNEMVKVAINVKGGGNPEAVQAAINHLQLSIQRCYQKGGHGLGSEEELLYAYMKGGISIKMDAIDTKNDDGSVRNKFYAVKEIKNVSSNPEAEKIIKLVQDHWKSGADKWAKKSSHDNDEAVPSSYNSYEDYKENLRYRYTDQHLSYAYLEHQLNKKQNKAQSVVTSLDSSPPVSPKSDKEDPLTQDYTKTKAYEEIGEEVKKIITDSKKKKAKEEELAKFGSHSIPPSATKESLDDETKPKESPYATVPTFDRGLPVDSKNDPMEELQDLMDNLGIATSVDTSKDEDKEQKVKRDRAKANLAEFEAKMTKKQALAKEAESEKTEERKRASSDTKIPHVLDGETTDSNPLRHSGSLPIENNRKYTDDL